MNWLQADDLACVERVASLLGDKPASAGEQLDPESQVSQLCAKLMHTLAALDVYVKSGEGEFSPRRHIGMLNS